MSLHLRHFASASARFVSIAVSVTAFVATAANAAVFQWDGGGANTIWSTSANWTGSAPVSDATNDLEFGSVLLQAPGNTTADNTTALFELNSITFNGTAGASFTLAGSSIALRTDGAMTPSIAQNSNFNQTINSAVVNNGGALGLSGNGTGVVTLGGVDTNGQAINKNGSSSYVLTGALSDSHALTLNGGTFAVGSGGDITTSNIQLRGGVLSMQGTMNRTLGASLNWGTGGGGFAAYGGTLTIDIGSMAIATWGGSNFVPAGSPLVFGSVISDNVVTFVDVLDLGTSGTSTREIRVDDNASSSADIARISGPVSASGGTHTLIKTGAGTLELASPTGNSYNGGTILSGGRLTVTNASGSGTGSGSITVNGGSSLSIGDGGTGGSVTGSILDNGSVIFNRSNGLTHSASISGTGMVTKLGSGTTTLTGSNSYSGGTNLNAGTLALGSSAAIGNTGTISFGGGTLQFSASNITDYSFRFSSAASQAYSLDTNGQTVTLANALSSSGGTLTKLGAGTLTLTGANAYSGTTTISAGTLSIGNGGTSGSIVGGIVNNSALNFNRSNALTYTGNISGTGSITKQGAGTLTLSGANSYSGGTNLNAGTLALGSSGAIGNSGTISFGGGTLQFSASNTTDYSARFSNAAGQAYRIDDNGQSVSLATGLNSSGGTLTKLGIGTLTVTGGMTYTGATTISAGTLSIGDGGTSGSVAGPIVNNSILTFNRSDAVTYSGNISGTGSLSQIGSGKVTLTGSNSYGGDTTITGGTLSGNSIADAGSFSAFGAGGAFALSNGAILEYTGGSALSDRLVALDGPGTVRVAASATTLTLTRTAGSGAISGSNVFTKDGPGTLQLFGTTSYTGATNINAGNLKTGTAERIPNGSAVTVAAGAMLEINNFTETIGSLSGGGSVFLGSTASGALITGGDNTPTTFSGVISGGGTLTKQGSGTLSLTGSNTHGGVTTINAGVLSIGDGGTTGSISGAISNNATLVFNRSNSLTHSSNISGTGMVTKLGSGTTTLTNSNGYTGGTNLNAGTLALGSSGAIGTTGTISFGGGTLQFSAVNTNDYSARFNNAASQAYNLNTNGQSVTLATALTSTGGTLTKLGIGTLTLTGANTLSSTLGS